MGAALLGLMVAATCARPATTRARAEQKPMPDQFVIARDHRPQQQVYAGSSPMSQLAAADLCQLLSKMTGGKFVPLPLPAELPKGGIFVTSADRDPVPPDVTLPIGSDPTYLEAFSIQRKGGRLWLVGKTELGVHHAVFRLLRELGYRWFFQSRAWQVIPDKPSLSYAGGRIDDRPAMAFRSLTGSAFARNLNDSQAGKSQEVDQSDWRRANGLAYTLRLPGSRARSATTALTLTFEQGAFGSREAPPKSERYNFIFQANAGNIPGYPKHWFDKNPTRYGVSAQAGQSVLEIADPEVRDCFWSWLSKVAPRRPEGLSNLSIEPSDGSHVISRSASAKALGSDSDQLVFLANDLFGRMQASDSMPQRYLTMLAGYYHAMPPTRQRASSNLFVGVMALSQRAAGDYRTTASLMKAWREAGASVALWSNYSYKDRGLLGVGYADRMGDATDYVNDTLLLQRDYADEADAGASAAAIMTEDNFGRYGLGYFLSAQLMWNPKADVPGLLEDFFARAFPSDVAAMRQYFSLFDGRGDNQLISRDTLARAVRLLQRAGRAAEAAQSRAEIARIDELKAFIHHNALWWKIFRAPHCGVTACPAGHSCRVTPECRVTDEQPALVRQLLEWDYRNRHSYMTSYKHDRVIGTFGASKQFGLSEFDEPKFWELGGPPTHADIQEVSKADANYFTPQPVVQATWAGDPAPVRFGAATQVFEMPNSGTRLTLALPVVQGRVEVALLTGRAADRGLDSDFPDEMLSSVRVWLTDSAGNALRDAAGAALSRALAPQLLPASAYQTVAFDAVAPPKGVGSGAPFGVLLHVDSGGYKVVARAAQGAAWVTDKARHVQEVRSPPKGYFFYVPKGTKKIEYFWNRSRVTQGPDALALPLEPHELIDAEGTVHRVTSGPQDVASVDVPPGRDGKIWCLRGLVASQLWFYSVPPYLSTSPTLLMVPRALAEADGLLPTRAPEPSPARP